MAASLFLPWKNSDEGASVVLPLPKPSRAPVSEPQQKLLPSSLPFQRTLQDESRLLSYYMTLSCNIWGMRALLCGSFFDPAVSCNLVSPWMQPVFEIIDSIIAREEFKSLAMVMKQEATESCSLMARCYRTRNGEDHTSRSNYGTGARQEGSIRTVSRATNRMNWMLYLIIVRYESPINIFGSLKCPTVGYRKTILLTATIFRC